MHMSPIKAASEPAVCRLGQEPAMLNGIPRFSSAQNAYFDLTAETELTDSIGVANDLLDVDISSAGAESGRQLRSNSLPPGKSHSLFGGYKGTAIKMLVVFIVFLIGIIFGSYFNRNNRHSTASQKSKTIDCAESKGSCYSAAVSQQLQQMLDTQRMAEQLRVGELQQTLLLTAKAWGMDSVQKSSHTIEFDQLSTDSAVYIQEAGNSSRVAAAVGLVHNAAAGTVTGRYLFANFGQQSELDATLQAAGVDNCSDLLLLLRSPSAAALARARACGAVGVVVFADNCNSVADLRSRAPAAAAGDLDIPAVTISFNDAIHLLSALNGTAPAPSAWSQQLTHFIGPSPVNRLVTVRADRQRKQRESVSIIAAIKGRSEPHSEIIIGTNYKNGCHTAAALAAIGESLAAAVRSGWRPVRSLLLAFWDSPPAAGSGSGRLIRSLPVEMASRVAAYIELNCDQVAGSGGAIQIRASPLLNAVLLSAANTAANLSIDWSISRPIPALQRNLTALPGSGSDLSSFLFELGIPSAQAEFNPSKSCSLPQNIWFSGQASSSSSSSSSNYQQLNALGRLLLDAGLRLASSRVLPMDSEALANTAIDCYNQLEVALLTANVSSKTLRNQVEKFSNGLHAFSQKAASGEVPAASANQLLLLLSRSFVRELSSGKLRNVLIGPSAANHRAGVCFPFVRQKLNSDVMQLQQQVNLVADAFHAANHLLAGGFTASVNP